MTRRFDPDAHDNVITWMKDGSEVLTSFRGQTEISFPNPIQTSDQGIYEIYYDNKRNQNRGGLYRLIVRVCDDHSGLCICPNNFKGPYCLEICRSDGGNRFGWNCEFRCSYRSPVPATQCHGLLFCLPDPYGCSCDVGAHGLACNTLCTIGTYGPGCSQTCHCAGGGSSCDIYSGICAGECQTGWSGDNCQIPDECVDGYYGSQCTDKCHCLNDEPCDKDTGECPEQKCALGYKVRSGQVKCQECEGGTFGLDCVQQCHCAPEACEKERGLCKGQCLDSWIEPYCQRISRLVPVRVNPYRPSSFTCFVEGILLPDEASVDLYRRTGSTNDRTGITRRSTTVSGSERAVVFDVASVFPEEYGEYVCTFTVENTGYPSTSNINPTFGEVVHITVLTAKYTDVGTSSGQYQCWSSEPDTDATLSFGRSAPVTTDISPPADVRHSPVYPLVRRVIFPTGDGWDRDGFGPFYCEASKPDRDVTRVTTFFQRIDAKFISSDDLFTKTVNVNDTGVMITMTKRYDPDASDNVITWMKDGSEVLPLFDGQTQISFPNPIQASDQGIYEIYYNNERIQNKGGLYRLIVKGQGGMIKDWVFSRSEPIPTHLASHGMLRGPTTIHRCILQFDFIDTLNTIADRNHAGIKHCLRAQ
eukprot:XP_011668714.1 PREDICTED: uncharacterized protein LOC105440366 [Strongylocentrotus purpuratus]